MGKVKQVIMGDEVAEEAARKKAETKREQKKLSKKTIIDDKQTEDRQATEKEETSDKPSKKSSAKQSTDIRGKKYLNAVKMVDKNKSYSLAQALDLVKKTSYSKFDGNVEAHFNVTEKGLRGTISLPHGTGKKIRVKVADDEMIGALEKGGQIDFDILVAHPSMMPKLAKVAKILGPKGLMPNPKTGTIGEHPEKLVESLSKGQVNWKTETDSPIIHSVIGKVSFETKQLEDNFAALVKGITKEKIVSVFLKPTMGPSVRVAN